MHNAHVDFARDELRDWNKFARAPWTDRCAVSTSLVWTFFAVGVGVYALLRMRRALENVGGDGWWALRPYDDQVVQMDTPWVLPRFLLFVLSPNYAITIESSANSKNS